MSGLSVLLCDKSALTQEEHCVNHILESSKTRSTLSISCLKAVVVYVLQNVILHISRVSYQNFFVSVCIVILHRVLPPEIRATL